MEVKNLRIGNLLTWKDQEDPTEAILTYVGGVLNDCIWLEWVWADGKADYIDCDLDCVKGIEITEDWLIKFGFDLVVKEGNQGEFRVYQLNEITYNTNHGWWWKHQLTVQPKYIHELQNLFFAITGTELEFKSKI